MLWIFFIGHRGIFHLTNLRRYETNLVRLGWFTDGFLSIVKLLVYFWKLTHIKQWSRISPSWLNGWYCKHLPMLQHSYIRYVQFLITKLSLQWRHNGWDSVSNHQSHDCLLNRLFRRRSNKTSKLRVSGLCAGNSPVTGEFPAKMASNEKKCFHLMTSSCCIYFFSIRLIQLMKRISSNCMLLDIWTNAALLPIGPVVSNQNSIQNMILSSATICPLFSNFI